MGSAALREETAPVRRDLMPSPDLAWSIVGWVALVLALIAIGDLALAWYPLNLGNAAWEFGTISASLDAMPALSLGLALLLAAAVARGKRGAVRLYASLFSALALVIVLVGVLYTLTIPVALRSVGDPFVALGLKKAIAKTSMQLLVYPTAFVWIAWKGWRHTGAR